MKYQDIIIYGYAVKSQIYIALTTFLLLELIRRTVAREVPAFSNFVEKIRMSLCFYLTLDYVCNTMRVVAKKVRPPNTKGVVMEPNLFSLNSVTKKTNKLC